MARARPNRNSHYAKADARSELIVSSPELWGSKVLLHVYKSIAILWDPSSWSANPENFLREGPPLDQGWSYKFYRGRTGLVVRALDSGSGDPGSILGWVGVLFLWARDINSPKVLVILRNRWLRLNMTEKLFTGTLNKNKKQIQILPLQKPIFWKIKGGRTPIAPSGSAHCL